MHLKKTHHQDTISCGISIYNRVFHITPFFELSLVLLTTHALGLYEVTKKISAL